MEILSTLNYWIFLVIFVLMSLSIVLYSIGIVYSFQNSSKSKLDLEKVYRILCMISVFVWLYILYACFSVKYANYVVCEILAYFSLINVSIALVLFIKSRKIIYLLESFLFIILLPFWVYINETLYLVLILLDIVFLTTSAVIYFLNEKKLLKNVLNYYSIKEALDNVPVGLLFEDNSSLTYENFTMKSLLDFLKIKRYKNINQIWQNLQKLKKQTIDEKTILVEIGKKYYSFSLLKDGNIHQIIAFDITEETQTTMVIQEKQIELKEKQKELKNMLVNVEQIEKYKEIIKMKSRIHDIIGQRLFIVHQFIENLGNNEKDLSSLKALINSMISEINDDESNHLNNVKDNLISSFNLAGLKIEFNTKLPKDEKVAQIIINVVRECATNSIRHANATILYVNFKDKKIEITDNGKTKITNVVESTGINGMRNAIESIGGTLTIDTNSKFKVIISI